MAKLMVQGDWHNATDVSFREQGKRLSDALAALGWVKTADTGQVDWATVLRPTTTTDYTRYEIWRMNDLLQATAPIFLKIEYAAAGTTTTPSTAGPKYRFSVGTGSNGAGALTGLVSPLREVTAYSNMGTDNDLTRHYFGGAANRLACGLLVFDTTVDMNIVYSGMFFGVERFKNADGTDNANGFVFWARSYSATHFQVMYTSINTAFYETQIPVMTPTFNSSSIGNDVAVYPVYPLTPKMDNPLLGAMAYIHPDISREWAVSVQMYGAPHTYLTSGPYPTNFGRGSTNSCPMILWE